MKGGPLSVLILMGIPNEDKMRSSFGNVAFAEVDVQ